MKQMIFDFFIFVGEGIVKFAELFNTKKQIGAERLSY